MSFKWIFVSVVLFQLGAFVPQCHSEFHGDGGDHHKYKEGRTFGFWNHGPSGFAGNAPYPSFHDFDQEASYSGIIPSINNGPLPSLSDVPIRPREFVPPREYYNGPNEFNEFDSDGRQFPFYFPFPNIPNFPVQQPPIFNFPQFTPWWQGDNVCVLKDEVTEDWNGNEVNVGTQPDFSINIQTCAEQSNKYVCKTITNRGGKKITTIQTRACCHGYSRFPQRQGPNAACLKVEMVSFEAAIEKYGYMEFPANITRNMLRNGTLLLPVKVASNEADQSSEVHSMISSEQILDYIIPNRTIDLEEIENEAIVETENGHSIRFNVYPKSVGNESNYEFLYHYTINCVPVVKPKIFATEGMVLGLESDLKIAEQNLMEILQDRPELSMFTKMIQNYNLTEVLQSQDAITVLAPNNDALGKMNPIERRLLMAGDQCADEYVKNHLVPLTLCSSAIVSNAKAHVNNLLKRSITFERNPKSNEILINHHSKMIELDRMGTNGVLHIIEKPLPSDAAMSVSSLLNARNSTIFAKLMTSSGYVEEIEDLRGVTFIVPTDKALETSVWKEELDKNSSSLIRNHTLYQFLNNHIFDGVIGSHDFRTGYLKSMMGQNLKMNLIQNGGSTLNCARFVSTDGVSCNRAVHQIDRPMEIATKSLLAALEHNENYIKFLNILKKSNLTHLVGNSTRDVTVLVPTNDVFEEQSDYYEEILSSQQEMESFVKTHIILNSVCCSSFPKYPVINSVHSLNGLLTVTKQRRPSIGNAHITKCDLIQKNGIIFEVNDIIEYKPAVPRPPFY